MSLCVSLQLAFSIHQMYPLWRLLFSVRTVLMDEKKSSHSWMVLVLERKDISGSMLELIASQCNKQPLGVVLWEIIVSDTESRAVN